MEKKRHKSHHKKKRRLEQEDEWIEAPLPENVKASKNKIEASKLKKDDVVDEFSFILGSTYTKNPAKPEITDHLMIARSRELNKNIISHEFIKPDADNFGGAQNSDDYSPPADIHTPGSSEEITRQTSDRPNREALLKASLASSEKTTGSKKQDYQELSRDDKNLIWADIIKKQLENDTVGEEDNDEMKGDLGEVDSRHILMKKTHAGEWCPYEKAKEQKSGDINESINEMIRQERFVTTAQMNAPLLKMSQKVFSAMGNNDVLGNRFCKQGSSKRKRSHPNDDQHYRDAVSETKKIHLSIDNCIFCRDSKNFKHDLLIESWENAMILAPYQTSVVDEQFNIITRNHYPAATYCDEDVSDFLKNLKGGICRAFADVKKIPIFSETFYDLNDRTHMMIEVFPLEENDIPEAKMYFKKGLMETDHEWSDHKKIIDVGSNKLQQKIPRGFAYFFVEFGMDGGYAHVIEDKRRFPKYFSQEVIGGLLDVDATIWLKPKLESQEITMKKKETLKNLLMDKLKYLDA